MRIRDLVISIFICIVILFATAGIKSIFDGQNINKYQILSFETPDGQSHVLLRHKETGQMIAISDQKGQGSIVSFPKDVKDNTFQPSALTIKPTGIDISIDNEITHLSLEDLKRIKSNAPSEHPPTD